MLWHSATTWLTSLLGPSPLAILVALVIAAFIPLLIHFAFYHSPTTISLPSFLLVGPTGSGKTALLTLLERGQRAATHTSQSPIAVEVSLPVETATASAKYRSSNDPSLQIHKRVLLVDTPGHGKLRSHAISHVVKPQNLRGIIFVVDAANMSTESGGLREAATYLHDVLLQLQKRSTVSKASRALKELPVLIAVNKLDLFTALPPSLVEHSLELEIGQVRASRANGLPDSGIGMNDVNINQEHDWLGHGGEENFKFSHMEEFGLPVTVLGGSVLGTDGLGAGKWWDWIGSNH